MTEDMENDSPKSVSLCAKADSSDRMEQVRQKLEKNKAFCALAWTHFYTEPDGSSKMCCISSHEAGDNKGAIYGMQSHELPVLWNSESYREARQKMAAGEQLSGCELCYAKERQGEASYRTWANDYWLNHPETKELVSGLILGTVNPQDAPPPVSFDVRIGTLCNLKCRMCSSRYSSQIEADPVHLAWNSGWTPRKIPVRFTDAEEWYDSPQLLEELKDFSASVQFVQIAGGEPTINRTQTAWLKHLVDSGRARDIDLVVWTNITNLRGEFYDLLPGFKSVAIHLSLDGMGDVLEYIRFPAKWSAIQRNIETLKSRGYAVTAIPVAQIYNAFHLPELFAWADSMGIGWNCNTVNGADFLKIGVLSTQAVMDFETRMLAYLYRRQKKYGKCVEVEKVVAQLIGYVWEEHRTLDRRALLGAFVLFTNDMDAARNQSFAKTCPIACAHVCAEIGAWPAQTRFVKKMRPQGEKNAPAVAA